MLLTSKERMKAEYIFFNVVLFVCFACSGSKQDDKREASTAVATKTYVLDGVPKTRLTLKENGSFDYINIDRKNFPNDLFFRTAGRWEENGDTIYLTSSGDSLDLDSISVVKLPAIDSTYSVIRFYDVYNDSIGFMYVTYPDGNKYNQGSDMGDRIFDWSENLEQIMNLEFHFVNYSSWKYNSDGKNYQLNVYLKPAFKPNAFKHEQYILKGDTLVRTSDPSRFVFIRLDTIK